jgi:hypothetical protein
MAYIGYGNNHVLSKNIEKEPHYKYPKKQSDYCSPRFKILLFLFSYSIHNISKT